MKIDKKTIKLQIWDTAGQERYRTITSAYYRGADGIVMVYDVTNEDSFRHISDWLQEVNRYASETTCKLIVGNKVDLPGRVVTTDAVRSYAEQLQIPFMETSALDSTNVNMAFEQITRSLLLRKYPVAGASVATSSSTVDKGSDITKLSKENTNTKSSKSSCC